LHQRLHQKLHSGFSEIFSGEFFQKNFKDFLTNCLKFCLKVAQVCPKQNVENFAKNRLVAKIFLALKNPTKNFKG
jgi:hypothetical protein